MVTCRGDGIHKSTYRGYIVEAVRFGITKSIDQMTQFLSDSGALVQFQDIIVLDPQWLANIMRDLVSFNHNFIKEGILLHSDIPHIWKDYGDSRELLLPLMEKFEIVYEMRDEGFKRSLVPCLLPENAASINTIWPKNTTKDQIQCGWVYEFKFLPKGIFGRILVRMHHIKGITQSHFWRYGAIFQMEEYRQIALVKLKSKEHMQSLIIKVRKAHSCTSPWILLRHIIDSIDTLLDSYYSFADDDMAQYALCVYCAKMYPPMKPKRFTAEKCLHAWESSDSEIVCGNHPGTPVPIQGLIPDLILANSVDISQLQTETRIGKGGFAKVHRGTIGSGQIVAIKQLIDSEGETISFHQFVEFRREAHLMSRMDHPNLVKLFGVAIRPMRLVMEFVPCGDLSEFLEAATEEIGWSLGAKIALDVARGMHYLHTLEQPIIHRDLRSPNIFLADLEHTSAVCAKVGDFGLSRVMAPRIGGQLGAWPWLAPEVLNTECKSYDEKSDVYSFAIVLWELASRKVPFSEAYDMDRFKVKGNSKNLREINVKEEIIHKSFRPTIPEDAPPDVKEIITECWVHEPSSRLGFVQISGRMRKFYLSLADSV
eukprot:TRINITY_DN13289_c0_g1_i2.p1 TRINITY_DN13289_c0_g1~~TRINITY_DN13289_c0_g1_i2.p1  ORF type:complete len:597 (+),score=147.61 TRINITY_DN13289_c0_g1_i2:33-1823(+)